MTASDRYGGTLSRYIQDLVRRDRERNSESLLPPSIVNEDSATFHSGLRESLRKTREELSEIEAMAKQTQETQDAIFRVLKSLINPLKLDDKLSSDERKLRQAMEGIESKLPDDRPTRK